MIAVTGIGLWSPGYADLAAWRAGAADDAVTLPRCDVADVRAKRGTSRIARMLGEVIQQAAVDAGADLGATPTVYASAWGEIDIMVGLLGQMADGDEGLSPLRFKHSVHNAAGGLVSIASGNTGFSTSVAAGFRSFEMGLLECVGLLESGASDRVLFALGEDRLPEPLARYGDYEALAVGLCLARGEDAPGALGTLALVDEGVGAPGAGADAPPGVPARYAASPVGWALPVVEALGRGEPLRYPAAPGPGSLIVDLRPAARGGAS